MIDKSLIALRASAIGCALAVTAMAAPDVVGPASAQQTYIYTEDGFTQGTVAEGNIARRSTIKAEQYVPTIWVDPDGCEHWVMDDGFEGFMTPHVTRDGKPVCNRTRSCARMSSDQLFATNRATIGPKNRARLAEFFQSAGARAYIIEGHTDSRASDAYNMRLSERRAKAVAEVARAAGVQVASVRGYGERVPTASNRSTAGMAKNRRVEILCLR